MTRSKLGFYCESWRQIQIFVIENFKAELFVTSVHRTENFCPFVCKLHDAQPLLNLGWRCNFAFPCLGPPWGPLGWSPGIHSLYFDPLHVCLCVITIYTWFHPQNIPQIVIKKYYDTLVQLRLVSGRHRSSWVFDLRILLNFI